VEESEVEIKTPSRNVGGKNVELEGALVISCIFFTSAGYGYRSSEVKKETREMTVKCIFLGRKEPVADFAIV